MGKLGLFGARHLVSRTGIGAEWETVQHYKNLSKRDAIVHTIRSVDYKTPREPRTSSWAKTLSNRNSMARQRNMQRMAKNEGQAIQKWWANHLLTTKTPFLERMTLFWHNHFPSSIKQTKQPSALLEQNHTLRRHAVGNYGNLLFAISKDPAMLIYLDGYKNVKGDPNENFARELLELFTLGGTQYYSERDIKEAARAFTGWSIDDHSGKFRYRADLHDNGVKTFMGKRGNFTGDDILKILLKHPRTAETIAEKMWSEFINTSRPNPGYTRQWAQQFRNANYDIKTLLMAVLSSDPFWHPSNMGGLIKSPVELAVGTMRMLPYRLRKNDLPHNLALMGQSLFAHPSVKGWDGGESWISTQSLMRRTGLLTNLTRGNLRKANDARLMRYMPKCSDEELITWLLPVNPITPLPTEPGRQRLVRALVLDPAYQVN
ncbi:MAG: hypothetical protein CSB47_02235 [Proteobacteria bacterium]|nr:MAG: hypothetical protein CSB47_02235 [Pseudomonadota bacterium]